MSVIPIDRFDDSRLEDYRAVADGDLLRRRNLFVAEGRLVVGRLIASGHRVVSLLLNEASFRAMEASIEQSAPGIPAYVCDAADFASLTGFNLHRGCLALAERPHALPAADVMRDCDRLLILEGVTDADNVGSAFRNAAAFGARVLLSPECCDPLYRKAIRTSMGSVLHVPYARLDSWPSSLEAVKAAGFNTLALTPKNDAVDLLSCTANGRVALLVGSEGPGLTPEAEGMADRRVRIPIAPDVDSLNLAAAAGIALHHFSRGGSLKSG